MVHKRLIPGRKEVGRGLIGEELGSGSLGALDGRGHRERVTSFIQPPPLLQVECNSKLDPTQTSFLKVSNPTSCPAWSPVQSPTS